MPAETPVGSAEIYNPATQSFSLIACSMTAARKFHSAILTSSGQVLIVGGVNAQNAVLNTAEVYDASSQSFYLPPTDMQTPRALATLKLLADGKVQIIGGDAELSMEVFDPSNGIFIAKALLPPNARPARRNAKHAEPRGVIFSVGLCKIHCSKGC